MANASRPGIAPEGQSVTFVELFFDLVFVFAITRVTWLVAHHLSLTGILEGILVFWMIWWAWTQFTWSLNPVDTNHGLVRFATLLATAIAFPMAIGVGDAYGDGGLMFVIPYVLIRLIGLGMQVWTNGDSMEEFRAVRTFGLLSLLGLVAAIVGGIVEPGMRAWFWLGTILLDFVAAGLAGSGKWRLHIPHFAERHGLIVIIALGESLIAAGNGAVSQQMTHELFHVTLGVVILVCILWWTYFGWLKDALEEAFEAYTGPRGKFARDIYSLLHFPMIAGIISLAVSIEEMVAHPLDPLHAESLILFVLGIILFVGAAVIAHWRAHHEILWTRIICLALLAGVVAFLHHADILWILGSGIVLLSTIVMIEARFHRNVKHVSA